MVSQTMEYLGVPPFTLNSAFPSLLRSLVAPILRTRVTSSGVTAFSVTEAVFETPLPSVTVTV
ncbi:MAG: hypothetical protein ACKO4W_12320 [Bacteroidota bacterium]